MDLACCIARFSGPSRGLGCKKTARTAGRRGAPRISRALACSPWPEGSQPAKESRAWFWRPFSVADVHGLRWAGKDGRRKRTRSKGIFGLLEQGFLCSIHFLDVSRFLVSTSHILSPHYTGLYSIPAPARGATPGSPSARQLAYFNSRPCARGDEHQNGCDPERKISIPAPARGATIPP